MPALFINLVGLTTTKNTEKMLLPIGAYMVSGPTGKKKSWTESKPAGAVQYSASSYVLVTSQSWSKKRESTLPLPTARAPVYSAAFWLLNDRIVKNYKMCTSFLWHMKGLATFSKLFLYLLAKKICSKDCNNQFIVIRNLVSWRI